MVEHICKRDGRIEPFRSDKIVNTIVKAMADTDRVQNSVHVVIDFDTAHKIAATIEARPEKRLDRETIQDLVTQGMINSNFKYAADQYIKYREERKQKRQKILSGDLYLHTRSILECSNITNDNANVDQYSFSGKENRIGEELHKRYAATYLLDASVRDAFQKNDIYLHDFGKYAVGLHNCLFVDMEHLLKGFSVRNGDVRSANSLNTAFQLCAVIIQCQSQVQFGGVGCCHIDHDLAPYVKKSFAKHFKLGLLYVELLSEKESLAVFREDGLSLGDIHYKVGHRKAWDYAWSMLMAEGQQAAEAFYHNLNTLESRSGSQVPFTSINFGRDTSPEGQMVSKWLMEASLNGIGRYHRTSIFPISIFQYKKGVNDRAGTPNYTVKKLAIRSLCKRIYPNWVNCDWSQNQESREDPDTYMATMGCRTLVGYDRNGLGYKKTGRGNVAPTTIILPKLGIEYGSCRKQFEKPDLEGFWKALDNTLVTARKSLLDRFLYIAGQSPKSAPFMYGNGTIAGYAKCALNVFEAMRHNTLAIGYIGIAEMCQALFGKNHAEDDTVCDFALKVVAKISSFAKESSDKYQLNFTAYATPAESLCMTAMDALRKEYGIIRNVTDRPYLTNSHHVPVWFPISIYDKLRIEAPFCKYPTGGCITYIELDGAVMNNEQAVEDIIDYAMCLDIPYLAFNFPLDSCLDCGYQGEFNTSCPECGSKHIQQLRRVTGYLTSDYRNFNAGKIAEVNDRVRHNRYTSFPKL